MKQINRSEFINTLTGGGTGDKTPAPVNQFANKTKPQFDVRAQSDLTEYTGKFSQVELSHLLSRTLFGVTPADLAYFNGMTLDQVVAVLLTPAPTPAPPINAYNTANSTDPDVPAGHTWVTAPFESGAIDNQRMANMKQWWIGLMINQNRSLTEKMTLFWSNHFSTESSIVRDARYLYNNNVLYRANALGNFKTLAQAVITDCAMLVYLNGNTNTVADPNENFGREFQELMTIGIPADPMNIGLTSFTQSDVEAAAAVLTGWKDDRATLTSYFNPELHDTSNKQFSQFYNNTVINGVSGWEGGTTEIQEFVNMLFANSNVALSLARDLYRYFVYYDITDTIQQDVIVPLAAVITANNYEIAPALSALFKSEHFFDASNYGCLIKNPADFLIGMMRQFSVSFPKPANYASLYAGWGIVLNNFILESMEPGEPPNVAGWPAYYQAPEYHELWLNSDTLPWRNQFSAALSSLGGVIQSGVTLQMDFTVFAQQTSNPGNPDQLIADSLAILSANQFDETRIAIMKSALLAQQLSEQYWTDAWTYFTGDPTNATYKNTVESRLRTMYAYIMAQPEYQLI